MEKSKREEIINGLRALQEECNKINSSDCPDGCSCGDICEMIYGGELDIPAMYDFEKLNNEEK